MSLDNETDTLDAGKKIGRSHSLRRRGGEAYRIFLGTLPRLTIKTLRWLAVLTTLVFIFELFQLFLAQPDKRTFSDQEIVSKVKETAKTIAERVIKLRDIVAADKATYQRTADQQNGLVLNRIIDIKQKFDDSLKTFIQQEGSLPTEDQYSVAIYDQRQKLLAWSSTTPLRSPWDSILTNTKYIEHKSLAIFVDRRDGYVWLVALRKISDTGTRGYVLSRALLSYAASEKFSNPHAVDFLDPVAIDVDHVLNIDYSVQSYRNTNVAKEPSLIIAAEGEPATTIGKLRIGESTEHEQKGLPGFIVALRELLTSLFIAFLIGSITYVLLKRPDLYVNSKTRLQVCEVVFSLFVIGRALIMLLGNFQTLLPDDIRNTNVFGIADLGGIAGNPFELFLSTSMLAGCIAIIAKVVTSSAGPQKLNIAFWKLTMYFLSFVAFQVLLLFGLQYVINGIVVNSTVTYYPIKQAIPNFSEMFVYFSIASVGFIYCTLAAASFVALLSSYLPLMRLENYEVLVGRGIALVVVILLFTSAAIFQYSPTAGLLLTNNYWLFIAIPTLAITGIAWLSQLKSSAQKRLSRFSIISGLATLVLVSGGCLIVAPLAASFELENNAAILEVSSRRSSERSIEYAAKLEAAFMQQSSERDTIIENLAYQFWNKYFRDDGLTSFIIISDGKKILSQYGPLQLSINREQFAEYAASLYSSSIRPQNPYTIQVLVPDSVAFAESYENFVVGVSRLEIGNSAQNKRNVFVAVLLTTAARSQLAEMSPFFFLKSEERQELKNVVWAVFEYNTLRQSSEPSLNIPSHLPNDAYARILSSEAPVRIDLEIDGDKYLFIAHLPQTESKKVVCNGLRVAGFPDVFEIVLHVHFLGILLAIAFSLVNVFIRAFFTDQQQVFIRFRERILLIVIVLAFIPLILVTNVTRSLLTERELTQAREQLAIDANAAIEQVRQKMFTDRDTAAVATILREAAATLHRSIQLYDLRGILRVANDDRLVGSGLISHALDIDAMKEIIINGKTFAISDISVGSTAIVRSAFQVLQSPADNRPTGILAIRRIDSAAMLEADIAATISFIYGVFAAIAVLLLLIGALFAHLLSRPISKVIQATEQVAGGAYGVVVSIDRQDEMGDLANAFNRMSLELDKSRERLAQSQREVAWKEMARQVAHEIKNPLTPMKLSVQHVEHAYETKDENFATIFRRVMRTLSEQIAVLTRIATEFSRFGEMPRRRYGFVSLKKVIESAVALFDSDRGRIRFVLDIPEGLSAIYADEEEFRRTLVNLIRNAVQAIEKWGVIIISASERRGLIHLKITDTGSGIPKETLAKVFDPNFSTKTSGMGLGLAIVKRSITDMSGQISVESEVGKGTTFHIDLPAREAPPVG